MSVIIVGSMVNGNVAGRDIIINGTPRPQTVRITVGKNNKD